jgi:hypothetical protein
VRERVSYLHVQAVRFTASAETAVVDARAGTRTANEIEMKLRSIAERGCTIPIRRRIGTRWIKVKDDHDHERKRDRRTLSSGVRIMVPCLYCIERDIEGNNEK